MGYLQGSLLVHGLQLVKMTKSTLARKARMLKEKYKERRINERHGLKLPVVCNKVGVSTSKLFTGTTVDVSSGGTLIDINTDGLKAGELVNIEMPIPPTEGLLEYGGRFSSYARVVRVGKPKSGTSVDSAAVVHATAFEFCESPKLQV